MTPEQLDKLERIATAAIMRAYATQDKPLTDKERFWIQKGIDGMRFAIAVHDEEP